MGLFDKWSATVIGRVEGAILNYWADRMWELLDTKQFNWVEQFYDGKKIYPRGLEDCDSDEDFDSDDDSDA